MLILEGSEAEVGDLVFDGWLAVAEAGSFDLGNDISAHRRAVALSEVGDVKPRIYVVGDAERCEVKVLLSPGSSSTLDVPPT